MKLAIAALAMLAMAGTAKATPNIVIIQADDMDYYSLAHAPNIAALASRGVTFENSFTAQSICGPSRASFLSGQVSHNTGIWNNGRAYAAFKPRARDNIGAWVQAEGYRTAFFGKTLNGYDGRSVLPGWNEWNAFFNPQYYDYKMNENGSSVLYGHAEADYSTDVLSRRAVRWLGEVAEPFFAYVAPKGVHEEKGQPYPIPAPRHMGMYDSLPVPEASNYNEPDVSDKPGFIRSLPYANGAAINDNDIRYRKRLETLRSIDDMVGDVVAELTRSGKINNTIIVFTSDNGWSFLSHRWEGKQLAYEEANRVPLIISGPGIPKGETRTELVNNVDLVATIVEWAGANATVPLDGRSLVPVLADASVPWRTALLIEGRIEGTDISYSAVRTFSSMYAEWNSSEYGHEVELYDLTDDPYEKVSRAGAQSRRGAQSDLAKLLDELRDCVGGGCWK